MKNVLFGASYGVPFGLILAAFATGSQEAWLAGLVCLSISLDASLIALSLAERAS